MTRKMFYIDFDEIMKKSLSHAKLFYILYPRVLSICKPVLKQDQIRSEMKAKAAEILGQTQQSPKQFNPSKLKIDKECQEERNIAGGMSNNIQNPQPITPQRTNRLPEAAQSTQEKFHRHSISNIEM